MAAVQKRGASGQSDLDVLSRLFVPETLLPGAKTRSSHSKGHLRETARNVIGNICGWMDRLYQDDTCPASGKPLTDCKECREGVSTLLAGSSGVESDNPDWRTPPHAHEFLRQAVAALNEAKKVLLL